MNALSPSLSLFPIFTFFTSNLSLPALKFRALEQLSPCPLNTALPVSRLAIRPWAQRTFPSPVVRSPFTVLDFFSMFFWCAVEILVSYLTCRDEHVTIYDTSLNSNDRCARVVRVWPACWRNNNKREPPGAR